MTNHFPILYISLFGKCVYSLNSLSSITMNSQTSYDQFFLAHAHLFQLQPFIVLE